MKPESPFFVMFLFKTTDPRPLLEDHKVKFFETDDDARQFMRDNHNNVVYEVHCIGKPGIF